MKFLLVWFVFLLKTVKMFLGSFCDHEKTAVKGIERVQVNS